MFLLEHSLSLPYKIILYKIFLVNPKWLCGLAFGKQGGIPFIPYPDPMLNREGLLLCDDLIGGMNRLADPTCPGYPGRCHLVEDLLDPSLG